PTSRSSAPRAAMRPSGSSVKPATIWVEAPLMKTSSWSSRLTASRQAADNTRAERARIETRSPGFLQRRHSMDRSHVAVRGNRDRSAGDEIPCVGGGRPTHRRLTKRVADQAAAEGDGLARGAELEFGNPQP